MSELSPRDRKAVLRVLHAAQIAYDLTRFPKKQVLDGAGDQERLHGSVAATRTAAAELSASLRERTDVQWKLLAAEGTDGEADWKIAKRVMTSLFTELRPLLGADPEAAFLPAPPPPKPRKIARAQSRK